MLVQWGPQVCVSQQKLLGKTVGFSHLRAWCFSVTCPFCSTASSSLNAMAAVTWEDIFKIKLGHLSDENQAKITKVLGAPVKSIVVFSPAQLINLFSRVSVHRSESAVSERSQNAMSPCLLCSGGVRCLGTCHGVHCAADWWDVCSGRSPTVPLC